MNKKEAIENGWTFTGSNDDVTAEKGRMIFVGNLALVLCMIETTERAFS